MTETGWPLIPREVLPAPVPAAKRPPPARPHPPDPGRQLPFFGAETTEPSPADLAGLLAGPGRLGRMGGTARVSVEVDAAWRVHVLIAEFVTRGLTASWRPQTPNQDQNHAEVRVDEPTVAPEAIQAAENRQEPESDPFDDVYPDPDAWPDMTPDPTLDSTPDPAFDSEPDPAFDSAPDPALDPAVGSAFDPAVGSALDPAVDSALDPALAPALGSALDPALDSALDPVSDSALDSAPDPVSDSALGSASGSSAGVTPDSSAADDPPARDLSEDDRADPSHPDAGRNFPVPGELSLTTGRRPAPTRKDSEKSDSLARPTPPGEPGSGEDSAKAAEGAKDKKTEADETGEEGTEDASPAPRPRFEVLTAYSSRLNALARGWPEVAAGLFLSGPRLRLWVAAAGEPVPGGYALGLDDTKDLVAIDAALVRVGLAGRLSDDGRHYLIMGKRRLRRLAELVGERPDAAPEQVWPGGAGA